MSVKCDMNHREVSGVVKSAAATRVLLKQLSHHSVESLAQQQHTTSFVPIYYSRLAQWIDRWTVVREVEGSIPDRTNTQSLK